MKLSLKLAVAVTGVTAMFAFTNCTKSNPAPDESVTNERIDSATTAVDPIDEIMRDLSTDQYSLSFDKPMRSAGITRTAYGADNYLAFADPQDLICGERLSFKQKLIPIWKIPVIVQPTCPDMVFDFNRLTKLKDLLIAANPTKYGKLRELKTTYSSGFLVTPKFTKPYAALQTDKIDEITNDMAGDKYILFNKPGDVSGGFTRSFYGYADLNRIVFSQYKLTLKDILKPTLKGCFDPQILDVIRQRLQRMDPVLYKSLTVTPLQDNKSIGLLYAAQ